MRCHDGDYGHASKKSQDLTALGPPFLLFNWPSGGGAVPETFQIPEHTPPYKTHSWIFSFSRDT